MVDWQYAGIASVYGPEVHTPITAFADVSNNPVNVDGVHIELLLGHRFPSFFASRRFCVVRVLTASWPA
jgi:hypothetical protein